MGRPARVGDAGDGAGLGGGSFEFGDAADRADAFDAITRNDGQPGRVIAPVFELLQAFDENGNDVASGCRRDDAAHD